MNPFGSEFACKDNPQGKCVSTQAAYDESRGRGIAKETVKDKEGDGECCLDVKKNDTGAKTPVVPAAPGEISYREASMAKMAKLLKSPTTPMVVPPTVMRVLVLPYQGDDDDLLMPRYVYFMTEKAKWIVGDYLVRTEGE
jgi:conjugal transfer pilus assembly protein TraV